MKIQVIALVLFWSTPACIQNAAAEIPEELEKIVFGDEKRQTFVVTVNDVAFDALRAFSEYPYLLWPQDARDSAKFPRNRDAVAKWLDQAAKSLGYDGFQVSFKRNSNWRGNDVWQYELVRGGLTVHEARIEIHWKADRFLGIVNHTPGRIRVIKDPPNNLKKKDWVYYPVQNQDRTFDLIPASVTRTPRKKGTHVTYTAGDQVLAGVTLPQEKVDWISVVASEFKEYNVPVGSFPDQISVDDNGIVWFSQPNNNLITEFDPETESFTQHATTGESGADGLIVGSQGRVWSGMYFSGSLGVWDAGKAEFRSYAAPYSNAAMAIPLETTDGNIWVTDHARNRISEFDPVSETWIQSLIMPTPACWVVQGYEDRDRGDVYFTEYSANQLGKIGVGGNQIVDIITPGGGPAFCVYKNDKVYYSRWNEAGIGVYDVNSNVITEFQFPIVDELGGPMWIAPNGRIVIGTRNQGYIMIFDPTSESFLAFKIPTNAPGLKDGMAVAGDGVIWFTESGVNKIAKLTLFPN